MAAPLRAASPHDAWRAAPHNVQVIARWPGWALVFAGCLAWLATPVIGAVAGHPVEALRSTPQVVAYLATGTVVFTMRPLNPVARRLLVLAGLQAAGYLLGTAYSASSGAVALAPIAIGIAIFRYHLYDINLVINKTLVYGLLAVFITGVYVAIVVGIGSLAQRGAGQSLGLSIAATAVVAIAFRPVREWVQRIASRLVYGQRATSYEVLADFAGRMARAYVAEDLLPRMARILAEGTGAARADVWLKNGGTFHDGAVWPPGVPPQPPARATQAGVPGLPGRPDPAGAASG